MRSDVAVAFTFQEGRPKFLRIRARTKQTMNDQYKFWVSYVNYEHHYFLLYHNVLPVLQSGIGPDLLLNDNATPVVLLNSTIHCQSFPPPSQSVSPVDFLSFHASRLHCYITVVIRQMWSVSSRQVNQIIPAYPDAPIS